MRASLERRFRLVRNLRRILEGKGYSEVDTPRLIPQNVPNGSLEALSVKVRVPVEGVRCFQLPTSPEIELKRLLSLGFESIFEISHV